MYPDGVSKSEWLYFLFVLAFPSKKCNFAPVCFRKPNEKFSLLGLGRCNDPHPDWSEARRADEAQGQILLNKARKQIKAGQLKEAKLSVAQIREQHMLAINARKEGILLMDSIELQTARQTLSYVDRVIQAGEKSDSLLGVFDRLCEQVKFYERKLDHDTKQL